MKETGVEGNKTMRRRMEECKRNRSDRKKINIKTNRFTKHRVNL